MNAREKKRLDLVTQQKKRVYRFSHRNSRDGCEGNILTPWCDVVADFLLCFLCVCRIPKLWNFKKYKSNEDGGERAGRAAQMYPLPTL